MANGKELIRLIPPQPNAGDGGRRDQQQQQQQQPTDLNTLQVLARPKSLHPYVGEVKHRDDLSG